MANICTCNISGAYKAVWRARNTCDISGAYKAVWRARNTCNISGAYKAVWRIFARGARGTRAVYRVPIKQCGARVTRAVYRVPIKQCGAGKRLSLCRRGRYPSWSREVRSRLDY